MDLGNERDEAFFLYKFPHNYRPLRIVMLLKANNYASFYEVLWEFGIGHISTIELLWDQLIFCSLRAGLYTFIVAQKSCTVYAFSNRSKIFLLWGCSQRKFTYLRHMIDQSTPVNWSVSDKQTIDIRKMWRKNLRKPEKDGAKVIAIVRSKMGVKWSLPRFHRNKSFDSVLYGL